MMCDQKARRTGEEEVETGGAGGREEDRIGSRRKGRGAMEGKGNVGRR